MTETTQSPSGSGQPPSGSGQPPSGSGQRSGIRSLLRAQAPWILGVTLVILVSTAAFSWLQTPVYRAHAEVVVLSEVTANGPTPEAPSMGTEKALVLSDVVASDAARRIGVPVRDLVDAADVTVTADTQIMDVSCEMPDAALAARCAQELGRAYVGYKDTQPIATVPERARVITPAPVPDAPSRPDIPLNLLAGLLVGLAAGLLVALLRDHLDDRVRGREDLERRGLRVLGIVPSTGAAAYGTTAARIQLAIARAAPRAPVLVVTTVHPSSTTVAPGLAAALASGGDRVVLVDADTRPAEPPAEPTAEPPADPTAEPAAGPGDGDLPGLPGLLDVLSGRVEPAAAARTDGEEPRLRLLPLGGTSPGVPAAIEPRRWARTVTALAESCDVVVVAAAPLLTCADGIRVARQATAILLAVDDRYSTRSALDQLLAESEQLGVPVLGCVLSTYPRPRLPRLPRSIPWWHGAGRVDRSGPIDRADHGDPSGRDPAGRDPAGGGTASADPAGGDEQHAPPPAGPTPWIHLKNGRAPAGSPGRPRR